MSNQKGRDTRDTIEKDLANLKEKFYETGDVIRGAAQHAASTAKNTLTDAKKQAGELEEDVIKYIKKNPLKAVGFGFLAGIITSIFLG